MKRDSQEYRSLVAMVRERTSHVNWVIGDAVLKVRPMGVDEAHNGAGVTLKEFAEDIEETVSKVKRCRQVASDWPLKTRVLGVTWTVHRTLSAHKESIKAGMTVAQALAIVAKYEPQSESDDTLPEDLELPATTERVDAVGKPVPEGLRDVFAESTGELLAKTSKDLRRILSTCKSVSKWNPYMLYSVIQDRAQLLDEAITAAIPHAVCQSCNGESANCNKCRHVGFVPRWRYEEMEKGARR